MSSSPNPISGGVTPEPGGIKPDKSPTEKLSELGKTTPEDAAKFQSAMGPVPGAAEGQQIESSPKTLADRIMRNMTSASQGVPGATNVEGGSPLVMGASATQERRVTPTLNRSMVDWARQIISIGKKQDADLDTMLASLNNGKEISQVEIMKLQKTIYDIGNFTDIVGKGVGLTIKAVQTGIRQQ